MELIDPYSRPEKNQIMLKRGFWALLASAVFLILWALFLPADWEERFGILAVPIRLGASLPITQSLAEAATLPKSVITGVLGLLAWLVPLFSLYFLRWIAIAHSPTGELRLVVNMEQKMSPVLWLLLWPVAVFCFLGFPWWLTETPEGWRTVGEGKGALLDEMIIAMLDDRLWLGVWSGVGGLLSLSFMFMAILYFPLIIWARLTGQKALAADELTLEERRLRRQRMVKSMPTKELRQAMQEYSDTLEQMERHSQAVEALHQMLNQDPEALKALNAELEEAEKQGGQEAVDALMASRLGLSKEEWQKLSKAEKETGKTA